MRALYYFLIGHLLFYIDVAISLVIPMHIGHTSIIFVPHLTLMYLVMICIYRGLNVALILSIIIGIITDVTIGTIYGIYLFGYLLLVVLFDQLFKVFYRDKSMLFILVLLSTLGFEIFSAIIYGVLGLIDFNIVSFIFFRIIPTLILNLILLIILFPILHKFFKKIQRKIDNLHG
ncbi:rod shape-determining protein MreD [Staphylococcus pettenkoferi]|uniref:Rod shape-determining protein MreD n=1 Tax=Staphylococcus pettenkoferi TaxID=170573 RepID=A0ABT4BIH5_9STAP|nr:rod shape-determining protein MreD [Staphylococcus pettenkoferi]MCY1564688.1 rod shape-determining protein MreD [Staphylococcus pettenkoferi]MCY1572076.1 rod shape-determining protein MreD [Staphylococcus pettenkoferi]MCY1582473.1 rod shape-determining protein MreD [Staphylococcus pettenkoferi]MCY1605576.1 rod shape-determining protein MreD [Staphylococcus pettenkoferi]MDH9614986.1 rod shape-determining protein MreD [Staphylococcus pettenkoferi]